MDPSGMGHYQQLTLEQRYGIYPHGSIRDTLLKTGHNQSEIAAGIGVHKPTISRELRRNPADGGGGERGGWRTSRTPRTTRTTAPFRFLIFPPHEKARNIPQQAVIAGEFTPRS